MFGSSRRGGVRGGHDRFNWDDVAKDKYKENYLGHSLFTSSKRTFNNPNPNPLWYLKNEQKTNTTAEIENLRREEEQIMKWMAMGLDPLKIKAALSQQSQLDKDELEKLTARGQTDKDYYDTAARVTGLGFGDERRPLGSKKISLEPPKEPETRLEGEFDPKLQKAKDEESKVSSVVNNTETPSETSNYSSHEMNSQTKEKKSKHHKDKKHKHKHKKDKKEKKRKIEEIDSSNDESKEPPKKKSHRDVNKEQEEREDQKKEREKSKDDVTNNKSSGSREHKQKRSRSRSRSKEHKHKRSPTR